MGAHSFFLLNLILIKIQYYLHGRKLFRKEHWSTTILPRISLDFSSTPENLQFEISSLKKLLLLFVQEHFSNLQFLINLLFLSIQHILMLQLKIDSNLGKH